MPSSQCSQSARIPKIRVVEGSNPGEKDIEVCPAHPWLISELIVLFVVVKVDEDPDAADAIDATNVPVCITFHQIGKHTVVDARLEEEACSASKLFVRQLQAFWTRSA